VALLHSLGVWRIEQLEALPRRELSSRFGPELLDCLDRVTGRLPEPLPTWEPSPQFEVRWSAEFPTTRRETLEAALEHLVRRLAAMLTQAGRGAMRLECLLKCTAGEPLSVVVGLFRPSAWANHLVQLLQVRFESLQLPGPVDSICLTAASTAPLELRQQEMFSEGQTRAGPHHLSGLIDRLSNRLGHTSVMRVRLIPDAQPELACHYTPLVQGRAVSLPRIRQMVHLPHVPRPLRLLTQPLRLPGGIEGTFYFAGQQQRIVRRFGPERIETGWWRGGRHVPTVGVARDYYRVETATGRWYWVFRRLPAGPWFLHGMFD
jgi:protein ImuB